MMTTTAIPFAELRRLLRTLGYVEKNTDQAHVFHRAQADLLMFRRYRDQESVDANDLVSTRKFLELWGLMEPAEYDAFFERSVTSA